MMHLDSNHADEEQLEQFSLGRLPESEVASIEEHLLVCGFCRVQLDATEEYVRAMRGAMRAGSPKISGLAKYRAWLQVPSFRWSLAPIAALMLLGLAGDRLLTRVINAPVHVQLYAMRGESPSQTGVANRPLDLLVDARGIQASGQYRLQVVDISGKPIWEGPAAPEGANLHGIAKTRLTAGSYFVRVYGTGPDALREYALLIR